MKTCKQHIEKRARHLAEIFGWDPEDTVARLKGLSVTNDILASSDGTTFTTPIRDENAANGQAGDHWRLQGEGGKHWVVLGMVANAEAGTIQGWGYKDFDHNGNGINKLSFDEDSSLGDRSVAAGFFSLEAMKSGNDGFPYLDFPAFGPNDTVSIGAYETTGADNLTSVQFWILPVPAEYEPPGSPKGPCKPCSPEGQRPPMPE